MQKTLQQRGECPSWNGRIANPAVALALVGLCCAALSLVSCGRVEAGGRRACPAEERDCDLASLQIAAPSVSRRFGLITEREERDFSRLLEEGLRRCWPDDETRFDVSFYLHCCALEDMRLGPDSGTGQPRRTAYGTLLDPDEAERVFGSPIVSRTRYGLRFHSKHYLRHARTPGSESHRDQVLATLLRAGVSLAAPIGIDGARNSTLADVLADTLATATVLPRELAWFAISVARALPPANSWTDKSGRQRSLDDVVALLIRQDLRRQSCSGVHNLDALLEIASVQRRYRLLSEPLDRRIDGRIGELIAAAYRNQLPSGGWSSEWWLPQVSDRVVGFDEELLVTGHLCEVLLRHDRGVATASDGLRRAVRRCLELLRVLLGRPTDLEVRQAICPMTHVFSAVSMARH